MSSLTKKQNFHKICFQTRQSCHRCTCACTEVHSYFCQW